jgi:hypothetical protein
MDPRIGLGFLQALGRLWTARSLRSQCPNRQLWVQKGAVIWARSWLMFIPSAPIATLLIVPPGLRYEGTTVKTHVVEYRGLLGKSHRKHDDSW